MEPRILSIQSHVVRGYVGNKCACFPLQILGFEVDILNSVQLSTHSEYPSFDGQILDSGELEVLINALRKNNLLFYSHVLTGYCSSESFLNKLADVISELKENNPNLVYLCDPVMGDHNEYYVPKTLLPLYKNRILPLADILTPNQFEAEQLTGIKLNSEARIREAMTQLHQLGIKIVILSSYTEGENLPIKCFASKMEGDKITESVWASIPNLSAPFTGTGDLFSSLMLGWLTLTKRQLKVSLEKTLNSIQAILQSTLAHSNKLSLDEPLFSRIELRLIQNKNIIENPPSLLKVLDF